MNETSIDLSKNLKNTKIYEYLIEKRNEIQKKELIEKENNLKNLKIRKIFELIIDNKNNKNELFDINEFNNNNNIKFKLREKIIFKEDFNDLKIYFNNNDFIEFNKNMLSILLPNLKNDFNIFSKYSYVKKKFINYIILLLL
jgi:hypothetical protein